MMRVAKSILRNATKRSFVMKKTPNVESIKVRHPRRSTGIYFVIRLLLFIQLLTGSSFGLSTLHAQSINSFLSADDLQAANLYTELQARAFQALDARDHALSKIKEPQAIKSYQELQQRRMIESLGGLPEAGPLNSRVVGMIETREYRIEKVIFDSLPNHRITANFYLPQHASSKSRVPGIAVSSGHSRTAKTADYNQRFGAMFAIHGMAALVFDPIGQGERSQILEDDGEVAYGGTTTEHLLLGIGSTLVGKSTATYRVWDGMRAIDYLVSRPEIDAEKIGYTGCSGGGTLTSYVMALDSRVACAAPACYLTTFKKLIETIGPQDAEQNLFGQLKVGLDQPDYVLMRAPKPTLISSTTQDFFDIDGSWLNFRQAKQFYGRLGFSERVDLVEIEGSHGVQPEGLATITHWMKRWLLGVDEPVDPIELELQDAASLLCTASGQVLTSLPRERSVIDMNREISEVLAEQRSVKWSAMDSEEKRKLVSDVLGVNWSQVASPKWLSRGAVNWRKHQVECGLVVCGTRQVPTAILRCEKPTSNWTIVLHDQGMNAAASLTDEVQDLLDKGKNVVLLDLAGQGKTVETPADPILTDWKTYYLAYLLGDSMVGLQTRDVLAVIKLLTERGALSEAVADQEVSVAISASNLSTLVALHAGVIAGGHVDEITLSELPASWSDVVGLHAPTGVLNSAVHGVLRHYDWPDLIEITGAEAARIETQSGD